MFKINDLSYSFNGKKIFDNLNFIIDKGFVSLYGNNNSGKTTLVKIISCILPTSNKISIDNTILNRKNLYNYMRLLGVYLNEDNDFLFNNVYDEMAFPLKNLGYSKKETDIRIKEILEEFEMSSIYNSLISDLSFIDRKTLLMMIALIHNPKVIVMDNPFIGFDDVNFKKIFNILRRRCDNGLIILYTTSDLRNTLYSDRLLILDEGKIVLDGKPLEIMSDDLKLVKMGIEIPFMVDLSIKLKFYKLIDDMYLDMEGLVDKLWV